MKLRLVPLLLVLIVALGCPRDTPPSKTEFTSADTSSSNRFDGLVDTLNGGAPPEADDGGEPREVVEPDVIRRDGDFLYILNQYRGLMIVDLEENKLVSETATHGFPRDLYVRDGRAYVIVAGANNYYEDVAFKDVSVQFDLGSRLYVVDIQEPDAPAILADFGFDGDLVDSRLVGDILYAVSAEYMWYWDTVDVAKKQTSASWVTSISVADPGDVFVADEVSFEGIGNVIHATSSAIFVSASDWNSGGTTITYVDIDDPAGDIVVRGNVQVEGSVADKFKMDAYNGILRVVSSGWNSFRQVFISTVDLADPDALSVLAELELTKAQGETLFATRFDGDTAYIVTYLQVDPLFVLDLSDPANPIVKGELEVPGWSTYIEPMGDRLLALGVDDSDGKRRVSVSLYDVSLATEPTLLDRATFGDNWSWSSAYGDVKALTVLDDLLIVPFSGYNYSSGGGYDRLKFISYTLDTLTPHGHVDLQGTVLRSFEYDGSYYGLTNEELAQIDAADLDNPEVVDQIILAENVVDVVEISQEVAAKIVYSYQSGTVLVRTVSTDSLEPLGAVEIQMNSPIETYAHNNSVVMVSTDWEPEEHYIVAIVDCSDPANPALTEKINVNVSPSYYYYWDDVYFKKEAGTAKIAAEPFWYPYFNVQNTFLLGDILALRCWSEEFDVTLGDGKKDVLPPDYPAPNNCLALVDLNLIEWTTTVELDFEDMVSLAQAGNKLYLGERETLDTGTESKPICAFYVREIDVVELTVGPAANVPGTFVQYDGSDSVLTLRDDQWNADGSVEDSLWTVEWDGSDTASAIDDVALPDNTFTVLGRGEKVFLSSYSDNSHKLHAATVSSSGALSLSEAVDVSAQWATILDAHADRAYLSVGGQALAVYEFTDSGSLVDLVPVMGYPSSMHFGQERAYVVLGYSGVKTIPFD